MASTGEDERPAGVRMPTFLAGLTPRATSAVLADRPCSRYRAGESLILEGDRDPTAFVLVAGWVKIVSHASDGEVAWLGLRGPGELVGEMSLVMAARRTADAVALTDVEAVCLPHAQLDHLLRTMPDVAMSLLTVLGARLWHADRWRSWAGALNVHQRLAILLLELTELFPPAARPGGRWLLPFHPPELAGFIATSARSVQRELVDLRTAGIVGRARVGIELVARDRLKASVIDHLPPGWIS